MARLSQTIAVEGEIRDSVRKAVAETLRLLAKEGLLLGMTRTYQPLHDDSERMPPETLLVQVKADEMVGELSAELIKLFDITATKDWANQQAKAEVTVDGHKLLTGAPVPYLLWLENTALPDLEKLIRAIPTLDPSQEWKYDKEAGVWKTEPEETMRTKKVPQVLVKHAPTKEHPAQTETWYDDRQVGTWSLSKFSGALPGPRVREILARISKLRAAVKAAREEANAIQVTEQKVGQGLFDYLLA